MNSPEMGARATPTPGRFGTEQKLIVFFGAVTLLIHFLTNSRYGYFRDELYYIACGQHLAFGYVDLAPLSALLIRLSRVLLGDSLFAIRFLPAVASALNVALTGMIARELGGRSWAVALSCTASLCALVFLAVGNFFSMNAFEPLFWMGAVYLLVRIINGGSPRLWLWFGAVVGLGLENKHSMAFFAAGVCAALLLTPERRHLGQKWIWLGGLIALALVLPNVIWQIQHDWATWELLRNIAQSNKNVVLTPAQFVAQQVLIMNPATLPLWLGGLIWLLASREGRRYRVIAIAYLITLVEFIIMHGKHYYLAPAYPMLFAAGGVGIERLFRVRLQCLKPALLAAMIAVAALLAPTVVPILSPEKLVAYMKSIHFEPPRTETSHTAALPQLFADQFGWEEMVASVAHVYNHLRPEDKERAAIFCQNYGEAGAIDFFGPKYGLPPAISGHQNYFLWGPRDYTGEVLLVLDDGADEARQQFESVEDLGQVLSSPWAMPWEQRNHIYLCRGLKGAVRDLWPEVKEWL
jgi:Dolichyl-phosphate-mannose-protein mannosyltransferase